MCLPWIRKGTNYLLLGQKNLLEGSVGLGNLGLSSVLLLGSGLLGISGGLAGSLGFNEGSLLLSSGLLSEDFSSGDSLGVRVESHSEQTVLKRVLSVEVDLLSGYLLSEDRLDFIRVDDSLEVRVGHEGSGQLVVALLGGSLSVGAVDAVELFEGISGPDAESTEVTSRGQLQEVESGDRDQFNSGKVAEGLDSRALLVVDNERSSSLSVSSVSHFTDSTADLLGGLGLLNVSVGSESLEQSNSS